MTAIPKVWGDEALVADDLNDNFELCYNEIVTRDISTGDKSVTIPANRFTKWFRITFGYTLRGSCGSANGSNGVAVLSVGGSTILTRTTQITDAGSDAVQDSVSGSDSIIFRDTDIDLTSSIAVTVVTSSSTIKGAGGTSSQQCDYIIIEGV